MKIILIFKQNIALCFYLSVHHKQRLLGKSEYWNIIPEMLYTNFTQIFINLH